LAGTLERHAVRAGEIEVALPNGRQLVLWSGAGDAAVSLIWWRGWDGYEPEAVRPWFQLAADAGTVLDVGANTGLFSLLAGLANPAARCFAFEPMPLTRQTLERNIRRNPLARVKCVPAAAGARQGTIEIYWDPSRKNDGMASADPSHRSDGQPLARRTVPVLALDDWAKSAGVERADLIKIDVERHEPEVLSGMQGLLSRRPDVLIEILDDRTVAAVADVVGRFGLHHYLLTPVGPVRTDVIARHPSCLNHLLTVRDDRELARLWR
jgi:FkbM family methyltransferase